jgi:uncharacterized protein (DUF697 family)
MSTLTEYSPQMESFEYEFESESESSGVFSEAEEMELAAELLEVTGEEEMEQFLGSLIKKAGSVIGKVVKSPVGKAIGGVLKTVAKKALPIAGGALGAYFGGPLGAKVGSSLGSFAGKAFGLELEGLSPEDREFETARRFVRFSGETVKNATAAPVTADPRHVAMQAAARAAKIHAPGLLSAAAGAGTGRWLRKGNTIIVMGV